MPTIAQQWIEQGEKQGVKKGVKKGIEIGKREAKAESLNEIIVRRFKAKAKKFEKQLAKLDLKALKKLTDVAWTVETLADFEKKLTKMLSKSEKNDKNGSNGNNSNNGTNGNLTQSNKSKLS